MVIMPKNKKRPGVIHALSMSSQVGFVMAACVIIGVFSGKYLDGLFGTSPLFILIMSLLGMAAAIMSIFKLAKKK